MKVLKVAVFVLFVAGTLAAIGWLWVAQSIRRLERTFDAAAEEARAEQAAIRRPVLRGEARAGVNAADEYRAILGPLVAVGLPPSDPSATTGTADGTLVQRIRRPPAPVPAWLAPFAAAHASEVAALREATRAERCDWHPTYDDEGLIAPRATPPLLPARILVQLLILEGQQRELAGDPRGAAERDLDAARFSADLGDANYIQSSISVSLAAESLLALDRLLAAGTLAASDLREVERELAILEPELPDARRAIRGERAVALGSCLTFARKPGGSDRVGPLDFPLALPNRGLAAVFWTGCDRVFRDFADTLAIADVTAREARLRRFEPEFYERANALARIVAPSLDNLAHSITHIHAMARTTQAAAAVARFRVEKGAYPATLAEAIAPPPGDPFAAGELRYARADDGAGAKVWSVGEDGIDDDGHPGPNWEHGDIVVELGEADAVKALKVAAFILGVLALALATAELWVRQSLARLEVAAAKAVDQVAAEQAAIVRPVLRGEARDVNAAEGYKAVNIMFEADPPQWELPALEIAERDGRPYVSPSPLSAAASAFLDRHRAELARLHEVTAASRCDWKGYEGSQLLAAVDPSICFLLIEGHGQQLRGDARGAAQAYLEASRVALDIGDEGSQRAEWASQRLKTPIDVLTGLIESRVLSATELFEIDRQLGLLERGAPDPLRVVHAERARMLADIQGHTDAFAPWPLDHFPRLFRALTWQGFDRIVSEVEGALAIDDPAQRAVRLLTIDHEATSSRNPLVSAFGSPSALVMAVDETHASIAAVRALATEERARLENEAGGK